MEQLASSEETLRILGSFSLDEDIVGMAENLLVVTDVAVFMLKFFVSFHLLLKHVRVLDNLAL